MLADDLLEIAQWMGQQEWIDHDPEFAACMWARAAILQSIAARLEGLTNELKGKCGKWNPHMDCSAYLDRQMTCPECPAHLMDWLDKEADRHG